MSGTSRKQSFPRARQEYHYHQWSGFSVQTLYNRVAVRNSHQLPKGANRRNEMTGLQTALNFNDFDKLFVGFDRLHNQLANRVTDYQLLIIQDII